MVFATNKEIGLQILPFDGNPYKILGMIGHPYKVNSILKLYCNKKIVILIKSVAEKLIRANFFWSWCIIHMYVCTYILVYAEYLTFKYIKNIYVCIQFLIITSIKNIFDFIHEMTTSYYNYKTLSVHVRLKYFNVWNFILLDHQHLP